ncbi:MAG: cyclase family protein, partial [Candidatus Omnitrophica bacterium]|nr:cyclase family protein [Candidatus Omnitrophota bacterium]
MPSAWIDISVPLHDGMVHWPTDPPIRIERIRDIERGDRCTVSSLSMGSHTGTHIDAPLHFLRGATAVDAMPCDAT